MNCSAFKLAHYLGIGPMFLNISKSSNMFLLDFLVVIMDAKFKLFKISVLFIAYTVMCSY
jgi:hypothetical protein